MLTPSDGLLSMRFPSFLGSLPCYLEAFPPGARYQIWAPRPAHPQWSGRCDGPLPPPPPLGILDMQDFTPPPEATAASPLPPRYRLVEPLKHSSFFY